MVFSQTFYRTFRHILTTGKEKVYLFLPVVYKVLYKVFFFSMEIIQPEDGHWGSLVTLDNNHTEWTGMVQQLIDKEADFCGASLTISDERSENIDFSLGILEDITSVIIINPAKFAKGKLTNINLTVFLTVFTKATWLAILFLAMLVASSHVFFSIHESPSSISIAALLRHFVSGVHGFFLSLIHRNENARDSVQGLGSRIFFLTVSAACFILLSCYEGDMTASMTVGDMVPRLKSFDDVLEEGYRLHTDAGSFEYDLVASAKEGSALKKIFAENFEVIGWNDFVRTQHQSPTKSAFYGTSFYNEITRDKDFLHLKSFCDTVSSQLAFAFQKDSEFRNIFNYHIIKIAQSGMLKQAIFEWINGETPDDLSKQIFQSGAFSLGYENLFFPMMVMLVGITAATLISFVEFLQKRRQK